MSLFDILDGTLDARFRRFHADNPAVYEGLRRLALELKESGRSRGSIKLLFEVLRWEHLISTKSDDEFRLNNNLHSRYARLLAEQEPELADFFEFRRLQP
jgi:hypothetical protein